MTLRQNQELIGKQFNKRPYHIKRAYDLIREGTALADLPKNLGITPRCYSQIFYLIVKVRKSKEPTMGWMTEKEPYWTSEEEMIVENYKYETLSTSEKLIYDTKRKS